jgi:hypothetical protein
MIAFDPLSDGGRRRTGAASGMLGSVHPAVER